MDYYKNCKQCPRRCAVDRNTDRAFCGESGDLRAALASLHFGEEPPVTGKGGSGTIFFTGCNLRCTFCQNYQISQDGMGRVISIKDFCNICHSLQSAGASNINLITGSHHIPQIARYITAAKDSGVTLPFCWNSSAYETRDMLELLDGLIDIWLPDLKTLDSTFSKNVFSAPDYPATAKSAIHYMLQKHNTMVIIRHLFMPGRLEDTIQVLQWLKENIKPDTYISLMTQYTPITRKNNGISNTHPLNATMNKDTPAPLYENRLTNSQEDEDLRDMIDVFDFPNLFYQELSSDTSWLPDFSKRDTFPNKLSKTIWHWTD